jgi:hypothetical protein
MTFLSQLPFDLKCELDHRIHKEKFNKVKEELTHVTKDILYYIDVADLDCRIRIAYFHFPKHIPRLENGRTDGFYWYWNRHRHLEPPNELWVYGFGIKQIKEIMKNDNRRLLLNTGQ